MPNDAEGLESNVSGLTHSSLYYVADNGSLTTTAGTDNPLAGKAIGTGALRLPTASISGGGGSCASSDTSKIFCGAVDLKNDSGVQSSFTLSKPANLNAEDIRSYVIEWYGIMTSTSGDYYVLQMKPYNSGSSVMNGTFYGTGFSYYDGSSGAYSTNFSTYLNLCYLGGETYQGQSGVDRSHTGGSHYTPSWNGQAEYENNKEYASLNYHSYMRKGSGNSAVKREWWSGGANSSATTSNYADAFYFEPRTGTWTEGVVSLYAITK